MIAHGWELIAIAEGERADKVEARLVAVLALCDVYQQDDQYVWDMVRAAATGTSA